MDDFARLNLIGRSPPFLAALALIGKFATCEATVLIQGETGTGKELAARAIHYLSPRRDLPFVPVNCGALPENLVESELFGHIRGAFTDAKEARAGLVAQARGGTLFLDEVEAMSPRAQVALLRFLQDKEYRPVGGGQVKDADVRVLAATNADLKGMVQNRLFRSDLLFRLNGFCVRLPALRDRPGDLAVLAEAFLRRFSQQYGTPVKVVDPDSLRVLNAYGWPGNVRELENLIQRECLLSPGEIIRIASVEGEYQASERRLPEAAIAYDDTFKTAKARAIAEFEQDYMRALLRKTAGNLSLASRLAGKDRSDLGKLLRKYGIDRTQFDNFGD